LVQPRVVKQVWQGVGTMNRCSRILIEFFQSFRSQFVSDDLTFLGHKGDYIRSGALSTLGGSSSFFVSLSSSSLLDDWPESSASLRGRAMMMVEGIYYNNRCCFRCCMNPRVLKAPRGFFLMLYISSSTICRSNRGKRGSRQHKQCPKHSHVEQR
jgi:hypothetical protein